MASSSFPRNELGGGSTCRLSGVADWGLVAARLFRPRAELSAPPAPPPLPPLPPQATLVTLPQQKPLASIYQQLEAAKAHWIYQTHKLLQQLQQQAAAHASAPAAPTGAPYTGGPGAVSELMAGNPGDGRLAARELEAVRAAVAKAMEVVDWGRPKDFSGT
ncbi:hypothetical protein WJX81_007529 [Elliptochloris bilobata]|uniref:Uncharacterized protein n=1 Tax=Elliptochloris bilobata TaxID=381761 RepID=A0AAW1RXR4_9CHLO